MLLGPWLMLEDCSLSVVESFTRHCSCLFSCMEKERSRIRAVQMDNLRGLLDVRKMDKVPNARIIELCGMAKSVDERVDEGMFRWFGHLGRMEKEVVCRVGCRKGGLIL